jgi:Terminase small subunit
MPLKKRKTDKKDKGIKPRRLPKLKKRILGNPNKTGNDHLTSGRTVDDPDRPLTDQNWVMLRAYMGMENPDVYQAYKMAGYAGVDQSGITSAWEIFNSPNFQKALESEVEARKQFLKVDMYSVIRNLTIMANANMDDFAEWSESGVTLKDSANLTRDQKYAIVEVKQTAQGVQIKLDSRQRATEMLATHLGFLIPDPSKGKDTRESAQKIKEAADELFNSVPTEPPKPEEPPTATPSQPNQEESDE